MNELNRRFRTALPTESASTPSELRGEFSARIAELRLEIALLRVELLKWMFFSFWFVSLVALGALIVAVSARVR